MTDLIARVSLLIGDTTNATFSTQQVQDWLDRTVQLVRYELLTAAPDLLPATASTTAAFNWATYVSRYQDWEADAVIQAGLPEGAGTFNWGILTPTISDYLRGIWTFDVTLPQIATDVPAQMPPVFATGHVYDPYLAAAMLLEMWAAQLADSYDFTSDGQSFRRSQRGAAKLQLARQYRQWAKPIAVDLERRDLQETTAIQPVRLIGESNDFGR